MFILVINRGFSVRFVEKDTQLDKIRSGKKIKASAHCPCSNFIFLCQWVHSDSCNEIFKWEMYKEINYTMVHILQGCYDNILSKQ